MPEDKPQVRTGKPTKLGQPGFDHLVDREEAPRAEVLKAIESALKVPEQAKALASLILHSGIHSAVVSLGAPAEGKKGKKS